MRTLEGPGGFLVERRVRAIHVRARQRGTTNTTHCVGAPAGSKGAAPPFDGFASVASRARDPRGAALPVPAFDKLAGRSWALLDHAEQHAMGVYRQSGLSEERHVGATYEAFVERVGQRPRTRLVDTSSNDTLPQLNDLANPDIDAARIGILDVKVAECRPSDRQEDYGGHQSCGHRAGLFRSVGDDAVEWECARTHPRDAARGAAFARHQVMRATDRAGDGFTGAGCDEAGDHRLLGLGR
jgi:hypothetical protein